MQKENGATNTGETPFASWAGECTDISLNYFNICESTLLSNISKLGNKLVFLLQQLATSCQCVTESSILLIRNSYHLWEADVLVRSALEGTMKYLYLCTGNEEERINKAIEYLDDLPIIYQLKLNNKAKDWLVKMGNTEEANYKPIQDVYKLQLNPDEFARFQLKYPTAKDRKQLEQKWSMRSILESFCSFNEDIYKDIYKAFYGTIFGYDMASHIAHQDANCIGLMWDRANREPTRKKTVEKAHAARELHDLIMMAQNRVVITRHMLGMDMEPIITIKRSYENLFLEFKKAQLDFNKIEYVD